MQANPTKLSAVTQLPAPTHKRNFSRSPSRSPFRKAQFAARELDPLLKDLSPDSTLEALQEADAVKGSHAEKNALAASISDATEGEREIGIRAAIAAKKLREWTEEAMAWPWPSSQDRAWGAGFLMPRTDEKAKQDFFGSLPKQIVKQYEDRLDEIWDAIETLGMDELKRYVSSSHSPSSNQTQQNTNYGRMRDFTALITATVIQSLPVLANLYVLLETWSIRLVVLRSIPNFLAELERLKLALVTVNGILSNEKSNRWMDRKEVEDSKQLFSDQIDKLGKKLDRLLDLLQDQEDRLPMAWIDSFEDIERKYGDWVSKAESIVLRNEMTKLRTPRLGTSNSTTPQTSPTKQRINTSPAKQSMAAKSQAEDAIHKTSVKRKPLLEINPRTDSGHKRGLSNVSMAESTLSNYSFENAEIIEAHATPFMPSPRISVIDHQFPFKKDASWLDSQKGLDPVSPPRPTMIQRASTASIEVVAPEDIRNVVLRKSASHDMLSRLNSPRISVQNSLPHSTVTTPLYESHAGLLDVPTLRYLPPLATSPSPSLRVDPLSIKGKEIADQTADQKPLVPRRSSKRLSMPLLDAPRSTLASIAEPVKTDKPLVATPSTPPDKIIKPETFDDKLKTILASMPTEIRLTDGSDSGLSGTGSEASSRSNSPTRPLKLSPVKDSKLARQNMASGIRVYHLKGGRTRESAPIKLHVRSVGENGERIMVRVGGGWADLAVYLREYSLHHASRGLAERKLEVANMSGTKATQPIHERPTHIPDQTFDFGLQNLDSRPSETHEDQGSPWRPPPVPILASNHNMPVALSTSPENDRSMRESTPMRPSRPGSRYSTITTTTPMVTTSVTSNYTPLGGAGPVHNNRRTASQNFNRTPSNDAWVEGMVSQARAVSGSQPPHNHYHSPNTTTPTSTVRTVSTAPVTTTTTIFSTKKRSSNASTKRLSSWTMNPISSMTSNSSNNTSLRPSLVTSPANSHLSSHPSDASGESSDSYVTATASRPHPERRKSRMGLSDVGGIKGLFSRKRSDP